MKFLWNNWNRHFWTFFHFLRPFLHIIFRARKRMHERLGGSDRFRFLNLLNLKIPIEIFERKNSYFFRMPTEFCGVVGNLPPPIPLLPRLSCIFSTRTVLTWNNAASGQKFRNPLGQLHIIKYLSSYLCMQAVLWLVKSFHKRPLVDSDNSLCCFKKDFIYTCQSTT